MNKMMRNVVKILCAVALAFVAVASVETTTLDAFAGTGPEGSASTTTSVKKTYFLYEDFEKGNETEQYYCAPLQTSFADYYKENCSFTSIPFTTATEFFSAWNSIPDKVENVVIMTHGAPTSFCSIKVGADGIKMLNEKTVNTVVLLSCNAGHLNYENSLASAFAHKPGINKVVAADGTVQVMSGSTYYVDGDSKWGGNRTALFSRTYNIYGIDGVTGSPITNRTTSAGWVLFYGDSRISIHPAGYDNVVDVTRLVQVANNLRLLNPNRCYV